MPPLGGIGYLRENRTLDSHAKLAGLALAGV